MDHQKWTPNTKKWRARDPGLYQTEKTDTSIPNQPEKEITDDDLDKKNVIPEPIDPNKEQATDK